MAAGKEDGVEIIGLDAVEAHRSSELRLRGAVGFPPSVDSPRLHSLLFQEIRVSLPLRREHWNFERGVVKVDRTSRPGRSPRFRPLRNQAVSVARDNEMR